MQAIQVAYVMHFNLVHNRRGHLFQERFTSWVIENEGHLLEAKEYIEGNPVKAGIVSQKEDYMWSSASGDSSLVKLSLIIL